MSKTNIFLLTKNSRNRKQRYTIDKKNKQIHLYEFKRTN